MTRRPVPDDLSRAGAAPQRRTPCDMIRPILLGLLWLSGLLPSARAQACAELDPDRAAALTLAAALDRVADCHPDVRAARAALAAAGADLQTAAQRPNPQLTLGAGSISRSIGSGPPWDRSIDQSVRVDQLVERGGKPALRRAQSEAARGAAQADLDEALRQARLAVLRAHQDLWALQARRAGLAASLALADESLQALQRRVDAGDAPALDATRFQLDLLRQRGELRQAEADEQAQQQALALAIGARPVSAAPRTPAGPPPPGRRRRPSMSTSAATWPPRAPASRPPATRATWWPPRAPVTSAWACSSTTTPRAPATPTAPATPCR